MRIYVKLKSELQAIYADHKTPAFFIKSLQVFQNSSLVYMAMLPDRMILYLGELTTESLPPLLKLPVMLIIIQKGIFQRVGIQSK